MYQELFGDGFPITLTDSISPVATASILVDRSCVNAGPYCVETGTLLGKAQVYADGAGSPMGLFQFGESLHRINLTKSDLCQLRDLSRRLEVANPSVHDCVITSENNNTITYMYSFQRQ
jgi:hypothetical protein